MALIGIVLAGGKASRLPNKALLPLKDGKPMISSAIALLRLNGCQEIVFSVHKDSLLKKILPTIIFPLYDCKFRFIDDEFGGIPKAIAGVVRNGAYTSRDEFLVVCCDNLYPMQVIDSLWLQQMKPFAVTRVVGPEHRKNLDLHMSGYWRGRSEGLSGTGEFLALTTPWFFTKAHADAGVFHHSLIEWFHSIRVKPLTVPTENWLDLGTEGSYEKYWEGQ